jgi:hypothetical protein
MKKNDKFRKKIEILKMKKNKRNNENYAVHYEKTEYDRLMFTSKYLKINSPNPPLLHKTTVLHFKIFKEYFSDYFIDYIYGFDNHGGLHILLKKHNSFDYKHFIGLLSGKQYDEFFKIYKLSKSMTLEEKEQFLEKLDRIEINSK